MVPLISLFVILALSLTVTRIGAVALRLTGMSDAAARFQARSAFTGTGFTTRETEQVVAHPVRRRIVSTLMLTGSLGIVAVSATLIVSLIGLHQRATPLRLIVFVLGVIAFFVVARSKWVDRLMCAVITRILRRWTDLETRDFATLLHLRDDYRIAEIAIDEENPLAGRTLRDLRLRDHGINVLGVEQGDNGYDGSPHPDFRLAPGQTLIVYGRPDAVEGLDTGRLFESAAESAHD